MIFVGVALGFTLFVVLVVSLSVSWLTVAVFNYCLVFV